MGPWVLRLLAELYVIKIMVNVHLYIISHRDQIQVNEEMEADPGVGVGCL